MRGVAYTGNNMKKRMTGNIEISAPVKFEMKNVYHKYPDKKKERKLVYDKKIFSATKSRKDTK